MNHLWENLFKKDNQDEEVKGLLKGCFIFQDLNSKELSFVKDLIHIRHYKPGEAIFRQGEVGAGMYIVADGFIDIKVENIEKDKEVSTFVTRLSQGDFLGELSLVEETSRRSASAFSVETAIMIGFFRPDLQEIVQRNPSTGVKISFRLSQVLGRRLKGTSQKVTDLKRELQKLTDSQ